MKTFAFIVLSANLLMPVSGFTASQTGDSDTPDQNSSVNGEVSQFLKGQSILIGGSYDQGTFSLVTPNAAGTVTDNGHTSPTLVYTSPEVILAKLPMRYGNTVIGINFSGAFKRFNDTYTVTELSNSVHGQNLGGSISGDYISGDPFVYLRLSNLYLGSKSYWLFGYGLGTAMMHYSGAPYLDFLKPASDGSIQGYVPISSPYKAYWYQEARWQFHIDNFDIIATGRILSPYHKYRDQSASYREFGLGISYDLHF